MKDLKPFIEKLKRYFSKQEGLEIEYQRAPEGTINPLSLWMQYHLDRLCITEFSFAVLNNEIFIKKFTYDDFLGYGSHPFPFEIILKGDDTEFTPFNLKEIRKKF